MDLQVADRFFKGSDIGAQNERNPPVFKVRKNIPKKA